MSIIDVISGFLGEAATKLHINVLNGNDTSHSPKNIDKVKIIRKDNKQELDKRRTKIIDKSIYNDHSTHTTNHLTLQINGSIDPNQVPPELQPLVEAYKNKQITFVTSEQQQELTSLIDFESSNQQAKSQLTFFKGKLSQQDLNLLRTGLYLKHLRDNNRLEEARKQWRYIVDNNSKRDRRVINLAGADYFNTYFRPFYKELAKDTNGLVRFQRIFDNIIDDMHFVVFVGSEMGVGEVIGEVVEKARKNIQYGVRDEIIYIHAAGGSVKTVEEALKDLRQMFSRVVTKRTAGKNILKASVYYRNNNLEV